MDKKRLRELAKNPNHIPGIYNYCDRWCERCPFTDRCLSYAMERDDSESSEINVLDNVAFWQKIHESFQLTLEMVKEDAEKFGIDLDSLDDEEAINREKETDRIAEEHPLATESMEYASSAMSYLDSLKVHINKEAKLKLKENARESGMIEYTDAFEVISWYMSQIHVKLVRALRGKLTEDQEDPDEFPGDSEGSAKVALIGIDRSMGAWGVLMKKLSADRDTIANFLIQLEQLKRKTEQEFPGARKFRRPGFDDL